MRLRSGALAACLLLVTCGGGPTEVVQYPYDWLTERIALRPSTSPHIGDTLWITSFISNTGDTAVSITFQKDCLDVQGGGGKTIPPFDRLCNYPSVGMSPHTFSVAWGKFVVTGPAGKYDLAVRHVTDPSLWIHIPITVR